MGVKTKNLRKFPLQIQLIFSYNPMLGFGLKKNSFFEKTRKHLFSQKYIKDPIL